MIHRRLGLIFAILAASPAWAASTGVQWTRDTGTNVVSLHDPLGDLDTPLVTLDGSGSAKMASGISYPNAYLTGTPTTITATPGDNSSRVASTAYADAAAQAAAAGSSGGASPISGAKTDPSNCATDSTEVSQIGGLKCEIVQLKAAVSALTGTLTARLKDANGNDVTYPSPLPTITDNALDGKTFTDTVAAANAVGRIVDTQGYGMVSIQFTANASANSVGVEESNDGNIWFSVSYLRTDARDITFANGASFAPTTTTRAYAFPVFARYVRWLVRAYVGGSITGVTTMKRVMAVLPPTTTFHSMNLTDNAGDAVMTPAAECDDNATTQITEDRRGLVRQDCDTRALIVEPYQTRLGADGNGWWRYSAPAGGLSNGSSAPTALAASVSGFRRCLRSLDLASAPRADQQQVEVTITDGLAGAVMWRGITPPVGGQSVISFEPPLCNTSGSSLGLSIVSVGLAGTSYINATGYSIP